MGLLDEAIREHLALKRGRGVDPAEIARQEKEALGPPTRSEAPAREEHGESEEAALDEPATAFAPDDDAPRAGREPSEPRLRLAEELPEGEHPRPKPEPDEPPPAPEGRGDPTTDEPPVAEPLRITEEDLRERMPGAGAPPSPPVDEVSAVRDEPVAPSPPVDEVSAVHDEPVAPSPPPADEDPPLDFVDEESHTDDLLFGDEDDDFFADELDEAGVGEREVDAPLEPLPPTSASPDPTPQPPADSERYVGESAPDDDSPADDPAAGPLDQPTQQYALEDVEDATGSPQSPAPPAGEEDEPEGEDLLEETPEFLEETPEHDRLWFEQKPPRDFDF